MTTVRDSLNQTLHEALAENPAVVLLGEDLLDPYGGAFKVTRGLSSAFPDRVITTPISEAGIVGLATGMALRGLRPVVEIMFGDFLTLAADQIINHAAKFGYMYNDQVQVPLVIRTPMGGRRGYGPTHSQTLEKHFLGTPGLQVIAPCTFGDPGRLLKQAVLEGQEPTLFIENKLLYPLPLFAEQDQADFEVTQEGSSFIIKLQGAPTPALTLAAYGYMAELARQAAYRLAYEQEIFAEVVIPTRLAPFDEAPLLASTRRTRRLLAIEEGSLPFGWGAEVLARAAGALGSRLIASGRVAAQHIPIPASPALEVEALPSIEDIIDHAGQIACQSGIQ